MKFWPFSKAVNGPVDPVTIIDRRAEPPCEKAARGECDALMKMEREELRSIVSEGVDKWLDRQFTTFGKWSFNAIVVALFGWLVKGVVTHDWRILP
jgi:hypothetical protein